MRRTKEEAEKTKKKLLQTAFELFDENGFERTSLEQICKAAEVTRGAAYWHFKNKNEIFEQTVQEVLAELDQAKQNLLNDPRLSFKEALTELLWLPQEMQRSFHFIYKTTVFLSSHPSFQAIAQEIAEAKVRLYRYFYSEVQQLKRTSARPFNCPAEDMAAMLVSLFEGICNGDIPYEIRSKMTKQAISNYINLIVDNR